MKLTDHIKNNHGGSQVEFAKANGLTKQAVWRMLNKNYWYVYGGMLLKGEKKIK